jgi:hypothetical protein
VPRTAPNTSEIGPPESEGFNGHVTGVSTPSIGACSIA